MIVKRFITKIVSITLAITVLFATSSFSVDMHFCCNKLVDMAFLGKARVCSYESQDQDQDKSAKKCSIQYQDCCSNKVFVKEGHDNLKKVNYELETDTLAFLNTFFYSYINLFEGLEDNIVPFKEYSPPLISKDIQVLHEVFLI